MDYERVIRNVLGFGILVFILVIYIHYGMNPHYYYTMRDDLRPDIQFVYEAEGQTLSEGIYLAPNGFNTPKPKLYYGTNNNGSNMPLIKCGNVSDIIDKNYSDIIVVRRYFDKCVIWDLPPDEPYIAKKSPFRWFIIKNQGVIGVFMLILAAILFIIDRKREKYKKKFNPFSKY